MQVLRTECQRSAAVRMRNLTLGERWHPWFDRIRETFYESTDAQDSRMKTAQTLCIVAIRSCRQLRLTSESYETILPRQQGKRQHATSMNKLTFSGTMLCRCEHLTTPERAFEDISRTSTFSSERQSSKTSITFDTPLESMTIRLR